MCLSVLPKLMLNFVLRLRPKMILVLLEQVCMGGMWDNGFSLWPVTCLINWHMFLKMHMNKLAQNQIVCQEMAGDLEIPSEELTLMKGKGNGRHKVNWGEHMASVLCVLAWLSPPLYFPTLYNIPQASPGPCSEPVNFHHWQTFRCQINKQPSTFTGLP